MAIYKTFITIDNPQEVVLSNLPFEAGQRVKVVILSDEDEEAIISQRFRDLFKKTQSLPEVEDITDEEILEEIDAYRQSQ
ncbi:MAG: hypothetical protein ACKO24_02165 [Leptolyngbyaceae cyanobacterium]